MKKIKILKRKLPVEHAHIFLLLRMLNLAISDIDCYFGSYGTEKEKSGGIDALQWIEEESGTFPLIITALDLIGDSVDYYALKRFVKKKKDMRFIQLSQ